MEYSLQYNENLVILYLREHLWLSREDRVRVYTLLNSLRTNADSYRNSPERRLAPGSHYFWYDILLRCSDGEIRNFWFVIDDSAAIFGLLRVEYADEGGPGRLGN